MPKGVQKLHRPGRGFFASILLLFCMTVSVALPDLVWAADDATNEATEDQAVAADGALPFDVSARSAILMDAHTGQILYSKNPDEPIQPASLAKIMVFDLVLEEIEAGRLKLDDRATVSRKAWQLALDSGVSRMFVEVGTEVSIHDLLFGLMVSSGNDAAVVLAEHLSGDEEVFVRRMNEHARELGMNSTHFVNSHGLEGEGQQTTASDVALLARHVVLTHPESIEYTKAKEFKYNIEHPQPNFNRLVFRDERITGLKTGHLGVAGYHLAATAVDGPMSMISVVMGTKGEREREDDAYRLINYGLREFETIEPDWRKSVPASLPVYKGRAASAETNIEDTLKITVPRGKADEVELVASYPPQLQAPIEKGEKIGQLQVRFEGELLAERALIAKDEVPRGGLFKVFWDSVRLFFKGLF